MNDGEVGILNVGAGDIRISFDPKNPAELIRAKRIVKDMLRGGYALLVEVEKDGVKAYQRALDFDEERCEYVIADYDPVQGGVRGSVPAAAGSAETVPRGAATGRGSASGSPPPAPALCECGCGREVKPGKRYVHGHHNRKRVPAKSTRAVAVSRSAGG